MEPKTPYIRYRKAHISVTVDPEQVTALDALVTQRRLTRAALVREALDLYLRVNSPLPTSRTEEAKAA